MRPCATLHDPQVARVLRGARVAYLGVEAARGPHVTPHRFTAADGRIWIVVPDGALKVRALRKHPRAGVLVRGRDGRSVVLAGTAEIHSLRAPGEAVRTAFHLPSIALAGASYAARNLTQMAGYAVDLLTLTRGSMPLDRVLIAIHPDTAVVVEEAALRTVAGGDPSWSALADLLPAPVAPLLGTAGDAVLGLMTPDGPVPLPASWDPKSAKIRVPLAALKALNAPTSGAASLTLDHSEGSRPTGFRGIVVQGDATRSGGSVRLTPRTASWWRGFETGTVKVADTPAASATA